MIFTGLIFGGFLVGDIVTIAENLGFLYFGSCIVAWGVLIGESDWGWGRISVLLVLTGVFMVIVGLWEIINSKKTEQKKDELAQAMHIYKQKEINFVAKLNEKYEGELKELSAQYGNITSVIPYHKYDGLKYSAYRNMIQNYGENFIPEKEYNNSLRKINKSFIVFQRSSTFFAENKAYLFKDVVSFDVFN